MLTLYSLIALFVLLALIVGLLLISRGSEQSSRHRRKQLQAKLSTKSLNWVYTLILFVVVSIITGGILSSPIQEGWKVSAAIAAIIVMVAYLKADKENPNDNGFCGMVRESLDVGILWRHGSENVGRSILGGIVMTILLWWLFVPRLGILPRGLVYTASQYSPEAETRKIVAEMLPKEYPDSKYWWKMDITPGGLHVEQGTLEKTEKSFLYTYPAAEYRAEVRFFWSVGQDVGIWSDPDGSRGRFKLSPMNGRKTLVANWWEDAEKKGKEKNLPRDREPDGIVMWERGSLKTPR